MMGIGLRDDVMPMSRRNTSTKAGMGMVKLAEQNSSSIESPGAASTSKSLLGAEEGITSPGQSIHDSIAKGEEIRQDVDVKQPRIQVTFSSSRKGTEKIFWRPLSIGEIKGITWEHAKFPPPDRVPRYPPEKTIQYVIESNASIAHEGYFCDLLSIEICKYLGSPKASRSQVTAWIRRENKELLLYIYFLDQQQAAIFSEILEIQWKAVLPDGSLEKILIVQRSVGSCHPKDLLTFEFSPAVAKGTLSYVSHESYTQTVNDFLRFHTGLTPVGLWRLCSGPNHKELDMRPAVRLTVRCAETVNTRKLAGYWRNHLCHDLKHDRQAIEDEMDRNGDIDDDDDDNHIERPRWLFIKHASRQMYCRVCKLKLHDWTTCSKVLCFNCYERGHIADNCNNPSKPKIVCNDCSEWGHIARDCPYESVDEDCAYYGDQDCSNYAYRDIRGETKRRRL